MKTLWRIIRHEWRLLLADRTLPLFGLLSAALIGYGIFNGLAPAAAHQRNTARLDSATERQIREWQQQLRDNSWPRGAPDPANPYAISAQQLEVALPPEPLALLSVGQSDLYAMNVKAYMWSSLGVMWAKSELQNPVNLQAGRFDLAFVVIWLFPLLVLALNYNLLSVEREDGTLALLLSQPLSLLKVISGKAIARAAVAIGGFLLISLAGLLAAGVKPANLKTLVGLFCWAALVAGYGLFWLALAMLVNLRNHSSAKNALTLAGAWLVFVFVIPSLLGSLAAVLYPVPPRAELIIADRDAEPNLARDGQQALAAFFSSHPELQPKAPTIDINESRRRLLAVFLQNNRRFEPIARRYEDQLIRQQILINRLRLLSPAIGMQEALNLVAGTGLARIHDFRAQVWQWVEAQRSFFVPKIMRGEKLTPADYDTLPRFRFQQESSGRRLGRLSAIALAFLLPSALLILLVRRRLRRYSVAG